MPTTFTRKSRIIWCSVFGGGAITTSPSTHSACVSSPYHSRNSSKLTGPGGGIFACRSSITSEDIAITSSEPRPCRYFVLMLLAREVGQVQAAAPQRRQLAATAPGREDLAGVEQLARVEALLQASHRRQIFGREEQCHIVALLDADTVLAADHSALLDRGLQHRRGRLERPTKLVFVAPVEENQWVQVAVAGVKHICDRQPILARHVADRRQGGGRPRARDDRID